MDIDARRVKAKASELGADLCGIAPVERFAEAPEGFHPRDLLPACRSVIVFAHRWLPVPSQDMAEYTRTRNRLCTVLEGIGGGLAEVLRAHGAAAEVKRSGPSRWVGDRYRDTLSLKHAAVFAGLGRLGRNTLIINERMGNMFWLGAVLTSAELEADPVAGYEVCPPGCRRCIDACPVDALAQEWIEQRTCYAHAYRVTDGAEEILCNRCRMSCPRRFGMAPQLR